MPLLSSSEDSEGLELETGKQEGTMADLICKNSVVAVRPNVESLSDYFLFEVTSDGVEHLEKTVISSGHCYAAGTKVLHGNFFNHVRSDKKGHSYRKAEENSIIPAETVLYVGVDLDESKNLYILSGSDHEDIMCWLYA